MFSFLKRQFKTKTGKLGLGLILGGLTDHFLPPGLGGVVREIVAPMLGPETGMLGMAAMFLRDKEAKVESP